MGFLNNLFKRKPGGTFIGNIIRGVAGQATQGMLGTGAGMITQEQADKRDLTDQQYLAKYGVDKNGIPVPGSTATPVYIPNPATTNNSTTNGNINNMDTSSNFMEKIKAYFKTSQGKTVLMISIVGIVFLLYKKYGKGNKRGIFN